MAPLRVASWSFAVLLVLGLLWRRLVPACVRRTSDQPTAATDLLPPPLALAAPPPPSAAPVAFSAVHGHEWMGGGIGFADRPASLERGYSNARAPRNATLLLLGVASGAKNFDPRNWVRRAFWRQRVWRLGMDWRFVVGTVLPRGDNDRVSLGYEAARHGDLVVVRGSELPPRQARIALRWWLHAATLATQPDAPAFFGLSSDAVLVSLPRLGLRLRGLPAERRHICVLAETLNHTRCPRLRSSHRFSPAQRAHRPWLRGPASDLPVRKDGGDLRWAAWPDAAKGTGGATWRCVRAATPPALLTARLTGDAGPPAGSVSTAARQQALSAAGSHCASASVSQLFLAASPELQLLSTPLLAALGGPLGHRLRTHRLEVTPPAELWERSDAFHQVPAGRTPSQPALLGATALARAVRNASRTRDITYLQLRSSAEAPPFTWDAEPRVVPSGLELLRGQGARALLVRGVTNGVIAEVVLERFERQRVAFSAAARVRCASARCAAWGVLPTELHSAADGKRIEGTKKGASKVVCCEEVTNT